jgi:hypothetical protein
MFAFFRSSCVLSSAALSAAEALPAGDNVVTAGASGIVKVRDYRYHDRHHRHSYRRHYRGHIVDAPFAHVESGRHTVVDAPFVHVYSGRHGRHIVAPFVDLWR